ncbi:MAG: hypothetical protein LBR37_04375 [Erysipelotrichaceae bacterium]|nr:hypothetical protein [Erysipelotrichaceae bacterium]
MKKVTIIKNNIFHGDTRGQEEELSMIARDFTIFKPSKTRNVIKLLEFIN